MALETKPTVPSGRYDTLCHQNGIGSSYGGGGGGVDGHRRSGHHTGEHSLLPPGHPSRSGNYLKNVFTICKKKPTSGGQPWMCVFKTYSFFTLTFDSKELSKKTWDSDQTCTPSRCSTNGYRINGYYPPHQSSRQLPPVPPWIKDHSQFNRSKLMHKW